MKVVTLCSVNPVGWETALLICLVEGVGSCISCDVMGSAFWIYSDVRRQQKSPR